MNLSRASRLGAAALCLALLSAVVAARRTFDIDLHWHLAIGRLFFERGAAPTVEVFSYSAAGAPWRYQDLVADVVLYGLFSRLSYAGLALLKAAVVCGMAVAVWVGLPAARRGLLPWVAGLSVLLCGVHHRMTERPVLFSVALFPLLVALCERARLGASGPPRALWRLFAPLVAVHWVWVQLHRESIVGLVVLAALAVYLALHFAVGRLGGAAGAAASGGLGSLGLLRRLLGPPPAAAAVVAAVVTVLGAALLALLNPYGTRYYATTLALSRNSALLRQISEWRSYPLVELWRLFPGAVAVSALGLGAIAARLGIGVTRAARPGPLAVPEGAADCALPLCAFWVVFAVQTVSSARWLPFLALTSALLVLPLLPLLAGPWRRSATATAGPRPWHVPAALVLAAATAGLLMATTRTVRGVGEEPGQYPAGALAFAREHNLGPRVVNASGFGGYLIWAGWPRFRVLIDGRIDQVYDPAFVVRCADAQRDPAAFAAMRREDGVDWVMASNREGRESHGFLEADPAYALVYWSEAALIYVRRDAYPDLVRGFALRHVRPRSLLTTILRDTTGGDAAVRAEVAREVRRLVQASPDGVRAGLALAVFLDATGAHVERDRVLAELRERHGDHPRLRAFTSATLPGDAAP